MGFGMLLIISKNLHINLTIYFHCRFVRLKGIQSTSVLCQVMGQFCVLCKYIRSSINLFCFVVWFLSKMVCSYLNIEPMVVRRFSITGSCIRVFQLISHTINSWVERSVFISFTRFLPSYQLLCKLQTGCKHDVRQKCRQFHLVSRKVVYTDQTEKEFGFSSCMWF